MKQKSTLNTFILASALALGTTIASAQNANVAVPTPSETTGAGLLGSRYTEASYNYIDLPDSEHADGFGLIFNHPVNANFDFTAAYSWARAEIQSVNVTVQDVEIGAKAFSTLSWGRPYVAAAVGWEWAKAGFYDDNSFTYKVGVGTEFQAAPALVVTPFVNFVRATSFNANEVEIGAKVAYRLNKEWSLTARAQYEVVSDSDDSLEYSIGAIYHF